MVHASSYTTVIAKRHRLSKAVRHGRRGKRGERKITGVSTTTEANIVYKVYNIAVGIVVHGEKRRSQANVMSAVCMKLRRDEKETEQTP